MEEDLLRGGSHLRVQIQQPIAEIQQVFLVSSIIKKTIKAYVWEENITPFPLWSNVRTMRNSEKGISISFLFQSK